MSYGLRLIYLQLSQFRVKLFFASIMSGFWIVQYWCCLFAKNLSEMNGKERRGLKLLIGCIFSRQTESQAQPVDFLCTE